MPPFECGYLTGIGPAAAEIQRCRGLKIPGQIKKENLSAEHVGAISLQSPRRVHVVIWIGSFPAGTIERIELLLRKHPGNQTIRLRPCIGGIHCPIIRESFGESKNNAMVLLKIPKTLASWKVPRIIPLLYDGRRDIDILRLIIRQDWM